jgi:hypothetical protein
VSDAVAVPAGRQLSWTKPLTWLPRPLLDPSSVWRTILVGWLLAFPASILLAGLVHVVAPNAKAPDFPVTGAMAIFLLVVFSPVLESLIMGGVLLILLRFMRPTYAVIVSAVGWGMAHSFEAPIWGLIIWWPFLIFSTVFVAWRERSLWLAFGLPMVIHGCQNLGPAILVALGKG